MINDKEAVLIVTDARFNAHTAVQAAVCFLTARVFGRV